MRLAARPAWKIKLATRHAWKFRSKIYFQVKADLLRRRSRSFGESHRGRIKQRAIQHQKSIIKNPTSIIRPHPAASLQNLITLHSTPYSLNTQPRPWRGKLSQLLNHPLGVASSLNFSTSQLLNHPLGVASSLLTTLYSLHSTHYTLHATRYSLSLPNLNIRGST